MSGERLIIRLLPGSDETLDSAEFQKGLRKLESSLRSQGVNPSFGLDRMYAAASESAAIYSGAVLLAAISPHVARCVVAWIKGRFGRKVRLEIGDNGRIKAEAQSPEEVEKLVRTAKEYRKSVAKSPQKVKPRRSKPQK